MSTIKHDGKTYTSDDECSLSNRVFAGWWGDAAEGEEYISEWVDTAHDEHGNRYQVRYHFDAIKGQEPEDDSDWPWRDSHIDSVRPL